MADSEQQSEQKQLDDRVQRVLNVIAHHIGSFHLEGRTGELMFSIEFRDGELPQEGFTQNVHEKVL